ncbi:hypothetical protein OH77DRAFT_383454 [Trametes cingulata]|nr:hypothetical protein OH77DRAFT_383454 [Trametes cingulata]
MHERWVYDCMMTCGLIQLHRPFVMVSVAAPDSSYASWDRIVSSRDRGLGSCAVQAPFLFEAALSAQTSVALLASSRFDRLCVIYWLVSLSLAVATSC